MSESRDCGRPEDGMCVEACEPGMCWAEPLGEACDHWKRAAEVARAERDEWRHKAVKYDAEKAHALAALQRAEDELWTWKQRLVDEQARLRTQLHDDRENAAENCAVAIDEELGTERAAHADTMRMLDHARDALSSLRAAWNAHMATCSQHAKVPSCEEIEAWRNAPSNTASAEPLPDSIWNFKDGS